MFGAISIAGGICSCGDADRQGHVEAIAIAVVEAMSIAVVVEANSMQVVLLQPFSYPRLNHIPCIHVDPHGLW